VLLVIKGLGYGGAERRLVVDTVAVRDRDAFDYEVAYVLADADAFAGAIADAGVPLHPLGATHNWDARWMARLRRILLAGSFDVVHFHLPYTASLGRLVVASMPRGRRPVVVYTEHSLWDKMAVLVKALNRATVQRDDAILVVSQAAHDALPDALKGRAEILVHGIDLSRSDALYERRDEVRAEVRAELGVADGELLVMTVANLRSEKGYDVLLDAAQLVTTRRDGVQFAAVGYGPIEEELRARHRELGLGERFAFLGRRDDALRLLAGADVFVLASHQEGLPVSLMEAMSVGLAIVATSVGGVPHVLTDGEDALVVAPGRPDLVAGAIERLRDDDALRQELGRAARRHSTIFDVRTATRHVEDLYRRLTPRPGDDRSAVPG
jgi:glycosyltransferase involved in cell wall biosynthesis